MSRYGPSVMPDSTRGIALLANQIDDVLRERRQRRADSDAKERQDKADARQADADELRDVGLAREGIYRGQAPAEQPDPFADEDIGLAEGAEPGLTLDDRMRESMPVPSLSESIGNHLGQASEPQVVALPGQYVRGMGVTKKAILSAPPQPQIGMADPSNRDNGRTQPRFRQLTKNYYESTTETPEYRARTAAEGQHARGQVDLQRMIGIIARAQNGDKNATAELLARDPDLIDNVLFKDAKPPVRGSDEYNEMLEEEENIRGRARARYRATDDDDDAEDEDRSTALRTAMAAAEALGKLDPKDYRDGAAFGAARASLARSYGFENPDDVGAELRALRRGRRAEPETPRVGTKQNPAAPVRQTQPTPRLRQATDDELAAIVREVGSDTAAVSKALRAKGLK